MSSYMQNSEWQQRLAGRATARELLVQVAGGKRPLENFMEGYKQLVIGYLRWFLMRHKLADGDAACAVAAERIWAELLVILPGKIAVRWSQGGVSFRELLREAVHEAYFAWSHPQHSEAVVRSRVVPSSEDDDELRRRTREDLLAKARERLRDFQRQNESRKNIYYSLFCLWDEDHAQKHEQMNDRLAAMHGGRRLSPANFRQSFRRSIETFGRYLGEAVGDSLAQAGPVTSADYEQAFEDLDLMDYAVASDYCKALMGLDIE